MQMEHLVLKIHRDLRVFFSFTDNVLLMLLSYFRAFVCARVYVCERVFVGAYSSEQFCVMLTSFCKSFFFKLSLQYVQICTILSFQKSLMERYPSALYYTQYRAGQVAPVDTPASSRQSQQQSMQRYHCLLCCRSSRMRAVTVYSHWTQLIILIPILIGSHVPDYSQIDFQYEHFRQFICCKYINCPLTHTIFVQQLFNT